MFRRTAIVILVIAGCAPTPTTFSGREEAQGDISSGSLKLYLYGEPTPAHEKFADLFAELCRGTVEQLGSKTLTEEQDRRIQDYNRYVLLEVSRRHGPKAILALCERSGLSIEYIVHKIETPPGR
jgi:hypothetical protein